MTDAIIYNGETMSLCICILYLIIKTTKIKTKYYVSQLMDNIIKYTYYISIERI